MNLRMAISAMPSADRSEFTARSVRGFGSTAPTTTSTINWHFLKRVTKLSEEQLGALVQKLGQRSEPVKKELVPAPQWRYPATAKAVPHPGPHRGAAEDREKLDHALPFVRRGGPGPEAATTWRSRSTNRRSTSAGPGCTKEMIRSALGCPIPERREAIYAAG